MIKLKISKEIISDNVAAGIIDVWVRGRTVSKDSMDQFVEWYKEKINSPLKKINAFRGVHIPRSRGFDFDELLNKRRVDLNYQNNYESWTVEVHTSKDYADQSLGVGFILSRTIKSNEYIDINASVKYLVDNGIKITKKFLDDCEVISPPFCGDCSLDKEIECVLVDEDDYERLIKSLEKTDLGYQTLYKFNNYAYALFRNKKVMFFTNFDQAIKYFRIKPDSDCTFNK